MSFSDSDSNSNYDSSDDDSPAVFNLNRDPSDLTILRATIKNDYQKQGCVSIYR
jgi:hypothetical protein